MSRKASSWWGSSERGRLNMVQRPAGSRGQGQGQGSPSIRHYEVLISSILLETLVSVRLIARPASKFTPSRSKCPKSTPTIKENAFCGLGALPPKLRELEFVELLKNVMLTVFGDLSVVRNYS